MERRSLPFFFFFWTSVSALLTPKGVNYEVVALMGIKNSLKDGNHVLYNWDGDAVDPCNWVSVSCSPDRFVNYLGFASQNLSGTLSPSVGNLTNLQTMLLQDNNISGPIPPELGRLKKLETLDLSDNFFTGHLPHTLSHMKSLHYLRLNNNSLTGTIPSSLANMSQLALLDISYNNLSGPVPIINAKTFNYIGNPEICAIGKEQNCFRTTTQLSSNLNNVSQDSEWSGRRKKQKMGLALGSTLSSICLLILGFAFLLWWRQRYNKQVFFDVNEKVREEMCLGNVRRFHLRELEAATNNFSSKNLIGKGGYGNVYKGYLPEGGGVIAVKRLKDIAASSINGGGGETQFQTEVEMISLAVHRNLLRLYGFCITPTERLLVYPYMSNGSVASRLKAKPPLDWPTRKRIALGAARGLLYMSQQL